MIEDRIREAFEAEAADVVSHAHARAENLRRLAQVRRRRNVVIPLLSALATASAVVALVAAPEVGLSGGGHEKADTVSVGAAGLPTDIDPRYRPTGPVITDRNGVSLWFAGPKLCRWQPAGGGDCRDWGTSQGQPGSVVGVVSMRSSSQTQERAAIELVYGVTDERVTAVRLVGGEGLAVTGHVFSQLIAGRRIWEISVSLAHGSHDLMKATVHFSAGGSETGSLELGDEVAKRKAEDLRRFQDHFAAKTNAAASPSPQAGGNRIR